MSAPDDLWLHKLTEQVDEPYQWQLTERRIDKHSVRYVLADKYVTLEAALGVQEMKDKRIAELEADLENVQQQRDQDVIDCQRIVASKHDAIGILQKRVAELEADCKHWKAVAYEFGPSEADNAFLDG